MVSSWTSQVVDLVSDRLALLADPSRVRLLGLLEGGGEHSVQELTEPMSSTPQNVSHHLAVLHHAGIVARRREGRCVYYSLTDFSACRLLEQTLASISGQVEELADIVGLTT